MKERQFRSSDWSWHSHGSLIPGKFDLKINRSLKTRWQEHSGVACFYSSALGKKLSGSFLYGEHSNVKITTPTILNCTKYNRRVKLLQASSMVFPYWFHPISLIFYPEGIARRPSLYRRKQEPNNRHLQCDSNTVSKEHNRAEFWVYIDLQPGFVHNKLLSTSMQVNKRHEMSPHASP